MEDGHGLWLEWARVADEYAAAQGGTPYQKEVALLEADGDALLGFTIAIATTAPHDPPLARSARASCEE
jgi:hypothetical protein